MKWHNQCRDLGIKPGFFDPRSEEEIIKSEDLVSTIYKIREATENNLTLFVKGISGIGKTTIKHYAENLFQDENLKVLSSLFIVEVNRPCDVFSSITLSLRNDEKLTKKLADREQQAVDELNKSNYDNFLFLIDNGELLNEAALDGLLEFQDKYDINLSAVLFAPDIIVKQKELEIFVLKGLNENEIRKYFRILNKKTQEKLPYSIPIEEVIHKATYYGIIETYVDYAWKIKNGIIKF